MIEKSLWRRNGTRLLYRIPMGLILDRGTVELQNLEGDTRHVSEESIAPYLLKPEEALALLDSRRQNQHNTIRPKVAKTLGPALGILGGGLLFGDLLTSFWTSEFGSPLTETLEANQTLYSSGSLLFFGDIEFAETTDLFSAGITTLGWSAFWVMLPVSLALSIQKPARLFANPIFILMTGIVGGILYSLLSLPDKTNVIVSSNNDITITESRLLGQDIRVLSIDEMDGFQHNLDKRRIGFLRTIEIQTPNGNFPIFHSPSSDAEILKLCEFLAGRYNTTCRG